MFRDRLEAGERLAEALAAYRARPDLLRRRALYAGSAELLPVARKTVLLVDDAQAAGLLRSCSPARAIS